MSEVRLVIREAARNWSGTIHGSSADLAIATLSADPVTMEELEAAAARFAKQEPGYRFFSNLSPGTNDEPYDAGLVIIDLIARMVFIDSTYSSREGTIRYRHDHSCKQETYVGYHLADDWEFPSYIDCWESLTESRRRELTTKPKPDTRTVFYGKPLLEFIASECFAKFTRSNEISAEVHARRVQQARERLAKETGRSPEQVDVSQLTDQEVNLKSWPGRERHDGPFYETIKNIHAAWLMTPRDDLGGACPREIALEKCKHLSWDAQDRFIQWSDLGVCPQGLDESTHAYRFAGYGTHELVMYYDLVRELLWSSWERLTELSQSPETAHRPESLLIGDFLAVEIPRLERLRDDWLDSPNSETRGRTPRLIIERERARLPLSISAKDIVDPDCPCCRMTGEMHRVGFFGFDGSGMDDEFAFDISCRTREEWDEEERSRVEFDRRFNAEMSEREWLGVSSSCRNEDGSNSIWSTSFSIGDTTDVPLGIRVFGIGCHLAELIVGLRSGADRESTPPESQVHIDDLNRDFDNLRELLQTTDQSLAEALIDPVIDRFKATLANVMSERLDLNAQCEAITEELGNFLTPSPPTSEWDSDDLDSPF